MKPHPTFVGGLMKSGTSLLRKLLSQHSTIYAGLETHWFSEDLFENFKDPTTQRAQWLRDFYDVSEASYVAFAGQAKSGPELLTLVLDHCTARAGKQRWVEKTPDNILHLERIWAHWPDARVIHVLRDVRDVYASWKRNKKRTLDFFIENVEQVRQIVGDRATQQTERYLEVRYEDLVGQPKAVLERVCAFIDAPFEPDMVDYQGDDTDFNKVLKVTGKASPTTESLKKPIFTSSVNQYREILTPEEIATIETRLASPMSLWGWA